MQNSQLPVKWVKPFAVDDANKVELPVTTATLGRASQSLGFPPITMQPPESGGVPPQGEDFNGAMNQVARFVWWQLAGGALPFDSTWASNAAIGGYPQGARIAAGDLMGEWISTVDNNTVNPDTTGTGWVPGSAYGATALTGLTNANVMLTPAQAAKPVITLAGTLTGNIQIIFPVWRSEWLIVNNTTGPFSVTVKTAVGAGVVVSQAGGQQTVWGDGTNLNALGGNSAVPLIVGAATLSTHAAQLGQTLGRLVNIQVLTATGTYVRTPGATQGILRGWGAGAGGTGSVATNSTQLSVAPSGGGGAYGEHYFAALPATQAYTIGAPGSAGAAGGGAGGAGGGTVFGSLTFPGAPAPSGAVAIVPPAIFASGAGAPVATGCNILNAAGQSGLHAIGMAVSSFIGGGGGPSGGGGGGGNPVVTANQPGIPSTSRGAGGGGGANSSSQPAQAGSVGGAGQIIVYEYA